MTTDRCARIEYCERSAMPYTLDVWVSDAEFGQIMNLRGSAVDFVAIEDKRTKRIQNAIHFMVGGTAWITVGADILTYADGIFDDGTVTQDDDNVLVREYAVREVEE